MTASEAVPLARLMAMAFRSLIDDLHERLSEHGHGDVRPAYGFVLLACRQAPVSVGDVAKLLGFTKQAASKLVDGMESDGYVRRVARPDDARGRRIQLTPRGQRALATVEAIYTELEAEWAAVLGKSRVDTLRRDLTAVLLARHGGTLPAVRPTF